MSLYKTKVCIKARELCVCTWPRLHAPEWESQAACRAV